MNGSKTAGNYLWRQGKKIPLEKQAGVFTVVVAKEGDLERVRAHPGVMDVQPVGNRVYRVRVDPAQRDAAMEGFRSGMSAGVCHHAYAPEGATGTVYYLTKEITVKFRPGSSQQRVEAILKEAGVRLLKEYPGTERTYLVEVTDDAGANPLKVANYLAELEEVEYAEPSLLNRFQSFFVPSDTYFNRQWHLRSWDGPEVVANADVSAVAAWDVTRGSRDVVLAVIDDGFDLTHPDFAGQGKVVHPKDYVDGDANPFPVTAEQDYHGTPCAGVALAEMNGQGVVGIAAGCSFMPVRFPLTASDDLLWQIFDYVGSRADVISCSWGPPPAYAPLGQLMTDKFSQLARSGGPRKNGCVIVFAAGNYDAPVNDPAQGHAYSWRHPVHGIIVSQSPILNGPAAHPEVIAVAASTSQNRKAAYSNWGKEISVCAPSNNFHPLDHDARVPGLGIWTTDNEQFGLGFTGGSRFTGAFGGTSSATPLVAGVAALVRSANPELNAAQIKRILQETADKIVDSNPDAILGTTKGNYGPNGHSEWFGYGRVNAARAVQRARDLGTRAGGAEELQLITAARGNLAATGATKLYKVQVGPKLVFLLKGASGQDFDLYLKRGAQPTTTNYDVAGVSLGPDERVDVAFEPGEYYVLLRSYRGGGDFELEVDVA